MDLSDRRKYDDASVTEGGNTFAFDDVHTDEGNRETVARAQRALEDLTGAISDLVP